LRNAVRLLLLSTSMGKSRDLKSSMLDVVKCNYSNFMFSEPEIVLPPPPVIVKGPRPEVIVIPKEPGPVCIEGAKEITDTGFDYEENVVDTEIFGDDLENVTEYGFGFWMKYTAHYPGRMYRGKVHP